jgi:hypothetical protein
MGGTREEGVTYPSIREMEIEIDAISLFGKPLCLSQCICQIILSRLRVYPDSTSLPSASPLSQNSEVGMSNVPQSHGIHTAITEDILSRSCSIATCSIFVSHIS